MWLLTRVLTLFTLGAIIILFLTIFHSDPINRIDYHNTYAEQKKIYQINEFFPDFVSIQVPSSRASAYFIVGGKYSIRGSITSVVYFDSLGLINAFYSPHNSQIILILTEFIQPVSLEP